MNETKPFLDFLREYAFAMPRSYRSRYDAFCVADHARLAFERGARTVNAGIFRGPARQGTPLCVAGVDRRAVLSSTSRATVLLGLDIAAAEAYSFAMPSEPAGVLGMFWVRQRGEGRTLREEESAMLVDLVMALGNRDAAARQVALQKVRRRPPGARVRFLEGLDGNLSVLEVETTARCGLLSTLLDVLFAERLQIVHCEVQRIGDKICDRFRLVEQDGGSIAPNRWRQLQVRILEAIARVTEVGVMPQPSAA